MRAYAEKNRERLKAQQKAWRERNAEQIKARRQANRAKARELTAAWRAANPERHAESVREWHAQNREKSLEYQRRYRERNRERRKVLNGRRKQQMDRGDLAPEQWLEILEEFDHACAYCQVRGVPLELEHMTPLSRGGQHTKDNVVPACRDCNGRKRARTIFEFLAVV